MLRKPWSEAELAELAAVKPRDRGAVTRHAAKHDRQPGAVAAQLQRLRKHGAAADALHVTPARFQEQIKLTLPDRSL
jgi:hypothetical protein